MNWPCSGAPYAIRRSSATYPVSSTGRPRAPQLWPVLQVEVDVRLGGIARVAAMAHQLARPHPGAGLDRNRPARMWASRAYCRDRETMTWLPQHGPGPCAPERCRAARRPPRPPGRGRREDRLVPVPVVLHALPVAEVTVRRKPRPVSRPSLFHPWKGVRSPASQASRSPGALRSQSGRISLVTARRSCQRSSTEGGPRTSSRCRCCG